MINVALIAKLKRRFWDQRSDLFRNASKVALGTLAAQALVLASTPLLTRLYHPESFGVLAVFAAVASLPMAVSSAKFELAIPMAKNQTGAMDLLAVAMLLNLGTGLLVAALIAFGAGDVLGDLLNSDDFASWAWALPLMILFGGMYENATYWSIRTADFNSIARSKWTQGVSQTAATVGGGLVSAGPGGLLLGRVLAESSGLARLSIAPIKYLRSHPGELKAKQAVGTARSFRRFSLQSVAVALLTATALGAPPILLTISYGADVAGLWMIARRVAASPLSIVGRGVSQAYFSEAAATYRSRPGDLRALYSQTARNLTKIGFPPIAAMAVLAPLLAGPILGDQFERTGAFILILAPTLAAQFVISPISQTLAIVDRQGLSVLFNIVRLALVAGALTGAARLGWSAQSALIAFSVSSVLAYVGFGLLCYKVLDSIAATGSEHDR